MTRIILIAFVIMSETFYSSFALADNGRTANDRLKSCKPSVAVKAAEEILNDPKTLREPLTMFAPAATLFQNGKKDEAVFWFYAAQLRARYQLVFEKGDRGQLLQIMLMTVGRQINSYAYQDIERLNRTIGRVLSWDKKSPNPFREIERKGEKEIEIEKIYSSIHNLRNRLISRKEELQRRARVEAPKIEKSLAYRRAARCRPGTLDPSLVRREIEKEKISVTKFVKTRKAVLREAGEIEFADVATYTTEPNAKLPARYTVSVDGATKTVYVEVNVSRSAHETKFTLACITSLSPGQRDSFKDVCVQSSQ